MREEAKVVHKLMMAVPGIGIEEEGESDLMMKT